MLIERQRHIYRAQDGGSVDKCDPFREMSAGADPEVYRKGRFSEPKLLQEMAYVPSSVAESERSGITSGRIKPSVSDEPLGDELFGIWVTLQVMEDGPKEGRRKT